MEEFHPFFCELENYCTVVSFKYFFHDFKCSENLNKNLPLYILYFYTPFLPYTQSTKMCLRMSFMLKTQDFASKIRFHKLYLLPVIVFLLFILNYTHEQVTVCLTTTNL